MMPTAPYAITVRFYEVTPDTNFVADPRKGFKTQPGMRNRFEFNRFKKPAKNWICLPVFDSFSRKAAASNYPNLPKQEIDNRANC